MIRNKARLVAQGYTQEEGIDYNEVFSPVARIEAIRLFLAYASFMNFVVYQMDVKSAFLYGNIEEEVYVCQPPGFEDPEFPGRVYKVEKALYGLHQASRAWYETLSTYLLDNEFQRGQIDKILFIKRVKSDILLVQVYVDDIIFGSTKKKLCTEFEKLMHKKFQISSKGKLTFFLGLQVTQKDDGIFISQDKYVDEILKKFGFSTVKTASTPMETSKPLMKDENAEDVDEAYTDSDYAGASLDRRSTTGGYQFLESRLISWQCKKQTIVANSTTKAEYVATATCYGQTKHIEIRHHFIRDSNKKKLIQMIKVYTDQNVADLLIKAFDVGRFQYLIANTRLVDGKKVIITETSVRRALQLKDAEEFLDLENTKTSQAVEITKLKERVKKLKRRNKLRTLRLKRLRKVGRSAQVVSSEDEGLGAQEDASKQGRKIANLDADAEEVEVEKVVSTTEVTTASATSTTVDELTLAQTLIEIKAAKPKDAKTIEPEKPLKKKDEILIDEEIAQKLQAQLNAELEEEEKLAKQREEDANM
ncbi:putative ribonuclease H-like domain-containing protein [Tanacetum coccineum]